MKKKEFRIFEYAIIVALVLCAITYAATRTKSEIDSCKSVFNGLIQGKFSVAKSIDWENLKALEGDVGAPYRSFTGEKAKDGFRRAFIKSFSLGFKRGQGRISDFNNWRLYAKDSDKTVIAADCPKYKKILLFAFSKNNPSKLISLEWKDMK